MKITFYTTRQTSMVYDEGEKVTCLLELPNGSKVTGEARLQAHSEQEALQSYIESIRQLIKKIDQGKPTYQDAVNVVDKELSEATAAASELTTPKGEQKTAETLLIQQSTALVLTKLRKQL